MRVIQYFAAAFVVAAGTLAYTDACIKCMDDAHLCTEACGDNHYPCFFNCYMVEDDCKVDNYCWYKD